MPRYDYECDTCHHRFELKQSFSSEPHATCPNCQNAARRVIHSVPIMFKGSGWYVNDYGKRGSQAGSSSDSKESSDSGSKVEPKSESKESSGSASKSESKSKSASKAGSTTPKAKGD